MRDRHVQAEQRVVGPDQGDEEGQYALLFRGHAGAPEVAMDAPAVQREHDQRQDQKEVTERDLEDLESGIHANKLRPKGLPLQCTLHVRVPQRCLLREVDVEVHVVVVEVIAPPGNGLGTAHLLVALVAK